MFSSHFLEHLTKNDGQQLLNDIYRILKPGGLVRILVPDLDIAIQRFNNGEINDTLDLFFYTSEKGDFSAHKYNYSFGSLKNKRSLVSIENLCSLIAECIRNEAANNQTFMVSDGEPVLIKDMIVEISSALKKNIIIFNFPPPFLKLFFMIIGRKDISNKLLDDFQVDISKNLEVLGWKPVESFRQGIRNVFK